MKGREKGTDIRHRDLEEPMLGPDKKRLGEQTLEPGALPECLTRKDRGVVQIPCVAGELLVFLQDHALIPIGQIDHQARGIVGWPLDFSGSEHFVHMIVKGKKYGDGILTDFVGMGLLGDEELIEKMKTDEHMNKQILFYGDLMPLKSTVLNVLLEQ